jgi:NTE family protein
VGLVLGAGGVVGQAYHAGVLASMEHDLGWDPRTAEIIVGLERRVPDGHPAQVGRPCVRPGVAPGRLAAVLDGADVLDALGQDSMDLPGISFGDVARPWRPPTFRLLARVARRPLAFRPSVAAATLLPKGRIDLMSKAIGLGEVLGDDWPPGLWLCVARRDDGGRVVLGRPGAPKATIVQAVAASCAIPTYFCPVEIEGVSYFDGGVHSPTSADVLRHEDLDLVVVVSPMSSARRLPVMGGAMRWSAHRRLMAEVRRLEARGTTVVRYEPDRRCVATMGLNAMADDRSERVVQQAFLEAGRLRLRADIRAKLAPLATRSQGGVHPA